MLVACYRYCSLFRYYPQGYFVQNLQMDFFNYAGLNRPVKLYTTPTVYLFDVTLLTEIDGSAGVVKFKSSVAALEDDSTKNKDREDEDIMMYYEVIDENGDKKGCKDVAYHFEACRSFL